MATPAGYQRPQDLPFFDSYDSNTNILGIHSLNTSSPVLFRGPVPAGGGGGGGLDTPERHPDSATNFAVATAAQLKTFQFQFTVPSNGGYGKLIFATPTPVSTDYVRISGVAFGAGLNYSQRRLHPFEGVFQNFTDGSIDVSDYAYAQSVVDNILFGDGNNGAVTTIIPFRDFTDSVVRDDFDTNFFGNNGLVLSAGLSQDSQSVLLAAYNQGSFNSFSPYVNVFGVLQVGILGLSGGGS